jgi:mannan endo-1,4-beta-mannosidase
MGRTVAISGARAAGRLWCCLALALAGALVAGACTDIQPRSNGLDSARGADQLTFAATANSNTAANRRRILGWLKHLPRQARNRVLSGQYCSRCGYCSRCDTDGSYAGIHRVTGEFPALLEESIWQLTRSGNDWQDGWTRGNRAANSRRRLLDHWQSGGLPMIHMPLPNPKNKTDQFDKNISDVEFSQACSDGNAINDNLNEWLDILSSHIAWLRERNVVTLIRPLHENNGAWFWYGARPTAAFKACYRYIFDYLSRTKGLDNLIFVYSPSGHAGSNASVMDYYPGDDYVDIVALDIYQDPPIQANVIDRYSRLRSTGKPFIIAELGWDSRGPVAFAHDATKDIVEAIENHLPSAVAWCSWDNTNSPAMQNNCNELYEHRWVMTKDEVAWASFVAPPGERLVALKAISNGAYVTAIDIWTVSANSSVVGAAQEFEFHDAGPEKVALFNPTAGVFLRVTNWDDYRMKVNGSAIGKAERFELVDAGAGSWALLSEWSGRYLHAPADGKLMRANQSAITDGTRFTLVDRAPLASHDAGHDVPTAPSDASIDALAADGRGAGSADAGPAEKRSTNSGGCRIAGPTSPGPWTHVVLFMLWIVGGWLRTRTGTTCGWSRRQ